MNMIDIILKKRDGGKLSSGGNSVFCQRLYGRKHTGLSGFGSADGHLFFGA